MDELLGRRVPYSMEAEQSVIGSMIIDSRCVPEVLEILKPEDFYVQQNREIFETIHSMFSFSQPIDPVTVLDRMKIRGVYDEQVSRNYVMQLMEITPTAANVRHYAKIVRDKSVLRQVAQVAGEVSGMVYNEEGEAGDILDAAEQKIYAIRRGVPTRGFRTYLRF